MLNWHSELIAAFMPGARCGIEWPLNGKNRDAGAPAGVGNWVDGKRKIAKPDTERCLQSADDCHLLVAALNGLAQS